MIDIDYFSLFRLPNQFIIDVELLKRSWISAASIAHPDRYVGSSFAIEKISSVQFSSYINKAYQTLKDPLLRAKYICERSGINFEIERTHLVSKAFLSKQLEWHDWIDECGNDFDKLCDLTSQLKKEITNIHDSLESLLDKKRNYKQAATKVCEWMFLEKLMKELDSIQSHRIF
ncbi:MAG: Fe-S protein assembly co-chaperone HscB [Bordetella sp.]|nr:MAG: Fe-S protein assembly co-chaperone HscB [Bordetella sp.]